MGRKGWALKKGGRPGACGTFAAAGRHATLPDAADAHAIGPMAHALSAKGALGPPRHIGSRCRRLDRSHSFEQKSHTRHAHAHSPPVSVFPSGFIACAPADFLPHVEMSDITVSVRRQQGEPLSITVQANATVAMLKRALQAPTSLPSAQIRLVFKGVCSTQQGTTRGSRGPTAPHPHYTAARP